MEPKICTKMLKKLSEKLRAKFPATTRGYSMVNITEKPKDVGHFFEKFLKFWFLRIPEPQCRKTPR